MVPRLITPDIYGKKYFAMIYSETTVKVRLEGFVIIFVFCVSQRATSKRHFLEFLPQNRLFAPLATIWKLGSYVFL